MQRRPNDTTAAVKLKPMIQPAATLNGVRGDVNWNQMMPATKETEKLTSDQKDVLFCRA